MSLTLPVPTLRTKMLARNHYLRAFTAYLLLAALFYLPLLLGVRTFPEGDFTQHFVPFSIFQRAELLAGRLPVWNPYTYAGHPFLADTQAAVFYPLSNLVLALTLPFGSPAARLYFLQVEAALHLALAGFFTYLLVYELTGRRLAAFLAGCVFAFSGYLTGYPPLQLAVLRTAIWLPLILWLLLRALGRSQDLRGASDHRWRWTVLAALAYTSAFLAGHPQTFLHLSYAVAAWLVLLIIRNFKNLGQNAAQALLFYGLFLGLSAAQLWPSLEFTAFSVRASVDYAFVSGGFPVQDTWQMLLPGVLTLFSPLYAGVIALGLALLSLVSLAPRLARSRNTAQAIAPDEPGTPVPGKAAAPACVLYFAALMLIALLVSYGQNGFLYPLFYRWLPGWSVFRGQERAAYLVAFGLSVLAGFGMAWLESGPDRRIVRILAISFAILVTAGTAVFAILWAGTGHIAVSPTDFWRTAATVLILAYAAAAICWRPVPGHRGLPVLLVLAVADLFLANFSTNLAPATPASAMAPSPEITAVVTAVQDRPQANLGLPGRVYNEYRVYDDYGMNARVEEAWGSSPLRLAHFDALFDQFPKDRMYRLLGIEHVLTWAEALPIPSQLLARFPQPKDTTFLHRLAQPNPRAWITHQARWADDPTARKSLADQGFNLDTTALLASGQTAPGLSASDSSIGQPGQDTIRLQRPAPNRLVAQVQSEHGGLLLVSENWLPGWQATRQANGESGAASLPVLRADLTLLAIQVPPGASTIELAYRPISVRGGLAISLGTAIVLLAFVVLNGRRRAQAGVVEAGSSRPTFWAGRPRPYEHN